MAEFAAEFALAAEADLVPASAWLGELCQHQGVPETLIGRLDLCLHEALANVLSHGGETARQSPVRLRLILRASPTAREIELTVFDAGMAFDPVQAKPKPAAASLAEAVPGGLGLTMIHKLADTLSYEYVNGRNCLSMGVRWQEAQAVRAALNVQAIPLFHGADPERIQEALADSEERLLAPGTPLLRPGEINHDIFIVLAGEVAAFLDSSLSPASAITIAVGDCVGELSAIDDKPVSALVVALSEARVLKISREIFWYRLMTEPGIARNLMVILSERMRSSNERALRTQRERLELQHLKKELDVARQLQASMLPLKRPMFPDRHDLDICGFMEPASDVGGDFFDAFFVDAQRLFFCIGDVSGHGIAAALFMARCIGLLRILAITIAEPDRLLCTLNDRLCVDNDTNLFVTLFAGFLDVGTGELSYSNGGHCAPLLVSAAGASILPIPRGALIGVIPGARYAIMTRTLAAGETLFCYTDGVTEAAAPDEEEFGVGRCLPVLAQSAQGDLAAMLDRLRAEVGRFTSASMLADDCTMLAFRRPASASD